MMMRMGGGEEMTNGKFTRLQMEIVDSTAMATELVTSTEQQQQSTTQGNTKPKRRTPKHVMSGFHSRDPVDIMAQILEVVARQDLKVLTEVRKSAHKRGGTYTDFKINSDGVISVNFIRRLVQISEKFLHHYVEQLVYHGLMEVQSLVIKRNTVKQIPVITDKGRQFLQVYREVKGMLAVLFINQD